MKLRLLAPLLAALACSGCIPFVIVANSGIDPARDQQRALMEASGKIRNEGPLMLGFTLDEHLVITALVEGGPAARDGIRVGDRILQVDHHPVATLQEARNKLWGLPDSKVTLKLLRGSRHVRCTMKRRCLPQDQECAAAAESARASVPD